MTVSAFSRERHDFLRELYDILGDLMSEHMSNYLNSQSRINDYNDELLENLTSTYGQTTLKMFPELKDYLEQELYNEYVNSDSSFWADYWYDIFGCEIDDERYYEHDRI